MCPEFRRGAEAIAKAQERKAGGNFRPFTPNLFWKSDGDVKYLLFLNDIATIPTVDLIGFIPVKGKKGNGDEFEYPEQVIARTDAAIGENSDPMTDEWDAKPKETCVAVAVELEPVLETVNGRQRPTGFEVKTVTFDRRVRDDEGELTDESEEVEAPVVGFITQSPRNFFNVVSSYDAEEAPIEETPVKILRVGSKADTVYTIAGYPDMEVDLGILVDTIENLNYIGDDLDDLLDAIDGVDDAEAARIIGDLLLDKRLEELADPERYDELFKGITETLDKFGSKNKKKSSTKERPARRSQRRAAAVEEEPEAEGSDPEPEEEAPAEKPARRTRTRKAAPAAEPEAESDPEPEAEEKPKRAPRGKQTDPIATEKLEKLRARTGKRKAAAA